MPIYESSGSSLIHLGYGDVVIATAGIPPTLESEFDEVVFIRDTPHPIGEPRPHVQGETTQSADCPVRIKFDSIESLDVLMDALVKVRGNLERVVVSRKPPIPHEFLRHG